jgi:hypothetical protein
MEIIFIIVVSLLVGSAMMGCFNLLYQVWRLLRVKVKQNEILLASMLKGYDKSSDNRD